MKNPTWLTGTSGFKKQGWRVLFRRVAKSKMTTFWLVLIALGVFTQGRRIPRQIYYEGQGNQSHGLIRVPLTRVRQSAVGLCRLVSSSDRQVTGDIALIQNHSQDPVQITGFITGLAPGYHGLHIHQNPNLGDNCEAAGPHFNPKNESHGTLQDSARHAGDLGNILVDEKGISNIHILNEHISLFANETRNVLGRSIVVHQEEDDLGRGNNEESKKTGNAGARVACCVIDLHQPYHL